MMKPVKVGLLGLGTVGGGTVNVLSRNGEEIARRAGRQIAITAAAVRDLDAPRICDTAGINVTTDARSVAVDPDVDVVVELMGGTELAREFFTAFAILVVYPYKQLNINNSIFPNFTRVEN